MGLLVSAATTVTDGRVLAAELMPDTGVITRGAETGVLDPLTGIYTPSAGSVIHTGPCRVKTPSLVEQQVVFGDVSETRSRFIINFPHDIPEVLIDDRVAITVSDDAQVDTRRFKVTSVPSKSYLILRQLGVEVIE